LATVLDKVRVRGLIGRPATRPRAVAGDKAYSSKANRAYLRRRRITAVIPEKKDQQTNRKRKGSKGGRPVRYDAERYRQRNTVERCFLRIKTWRGAMGLGLRQGEALGLRRAYVDLDAASIRIWWQLQRLGWKHGCDDPHACGRHLHKVSPCPAGCTRHAPTCPKRQGGGLVFTKPKAKSKRTAPLPPPLIPLLREHLAWLEQERETAANLWEEHDLLFCQPNGRPIDPRDDWGEFKGPLKDAGIRDAPVHDGRHTAGSLLNELGVDIGTIMEILGHRQMSVTRRYVHISTPMAQEAARRMGEALSGTSGKAGKPTTETKTETTGTRAARAKRRRRIV
jgi:integrase